MEEKIIRMNVFYKLIENNDNDIYVFPFMNLVIELILDIKLISDNGMKILSRDIVSDFEDLKNKQHENKARMFILLYFTCVYHLCNCFSSFVLVFFESEEGKYFELKKEMVRIDDDFIFKLLEIKKRVYPFVEIAKNILDQETEKIEDDIQAKIFDENKRKVIGKEKYFPENPIYCPAEIPEGAIGIN